MISLSDGRSELYQWDTGRQVSFKGSCQQFHFSNKVYGRTVDVDASTGDGTSTAKIPDFLLQTASPLSVYAFVGSDLDGYTKVEKVFQVQRRNKPADYVFTPPEQHTIQDAKEYAESAQKSAQTATETLEKIKPLAESTQENATEAAKSADKAQTDAIQAGKAEEAARGSAQEAAQEADRATNNILNGVDTHNQDHGSHPFLLSEVSRVESIAKGRNFGVVFDTKDQMESWLAIPENVKTLEVGTNLYIRDINTPDYWWDGQKAQELEVEHPDLTQYVTKTQLSMELPAVVTQEEYDRLQAAGQLVPGRIYYIDLTQGGV